jgi:hypothetical protein
VNSHKKLLTILFSLVLFNLSIKAQSCANNEWLNQIKDPDKEKLLLLQTQITALKLASLIDVYQNSKSNEEREKALDFISKIGSPLDQDHPFTRAFEKTHQTEKLLALVEEAQRAMSSGGLTIGYDQMPALLMAYEISTGNGIFNNKDFAVATFWEENNPNQNMVNPILEQLISIYHNLSRRERESIYNNIRPELQERWQQITSSAQALGCEIEDINFFNRCHNQAALVLSELAIPFEELSVQVTNILGHDLTQQLQNFSRGNIDWRLHPPPQEVISLPNELRKTIDGLSFTEYRHQRAWYQEIQEQDNLDFLQTFQKLKGKGHYLVLDKAKRRVFLYEAEGTLKGSIEVGLEITFNNNSPLQVDQRADQAMENQRGAGAGIYDLTEVNEGLFTLRDQRGRQQLITSQNKGVDCSSGSCTQMVANLGALLDRHNTELPLPFYILPLNENLEFVIKNDELAFTTFERMSGYYRYNFTPRQNTAFPTRFEVTQSEYNTPFSREFLKALEEEKSTLMKIYNLDNDEFNELALLAFGILGQESQFGSHWRYKVKETFPGGVAYLKNYKRIFGDFKEDRDQVGFWGAIGDLLSDSWSNEIDFITGDLSLDQNSRGPTQIKRIPALIEEHYGMTKEQLEEPRNAAIATVGFLAQSLEELKAKEKFHPAINGKNRFDYLHYIYMGKSSEIINGTATPERNIYYQNVRSFSRSLKIWQDLTNPS